MCLPSWLQVYFDAQNFLGLFGIELKESETFLGLDSGLGARPMLPPSSERCVAIHESGTSTRFANLALQIKCKSVERPWFGTLKRFEKIEPNLILGHFSA